MSFEVTFSRTYLNQLLAVPPSETHLILEKVNILTQNPAPDSKNKKRLQGLQKPVFRIRAGNYRIVYSFDENERWVKLLKVEKRDEVYDDIDVLDTNRPEFDLSLIPTDVEILAIEPEPIIATPKADIPSSAEFERPIDENLLDQLHIQEKHRPALRRCRNVDDLLIAYIPDDVRERVFDVVSSPPVDIVLEKPSLVLANTDDLIRYQRGELIDFLLKLDPDQQRYVTRAISGGGPVLIKGGPGTGKSTIAIYRVKEVLDLIRKRAAQPNLLEPVKTAQPRILFTTYTNALIASTRQLLEQLLGDDARLVTVETADKIARSVVYDHDRSCEFAKDNQLRECFRRSVQQFQRNEPRISQMMLKQLIDGFSDQYLIDEIEDIIVARNVRSLADYQALSRTGRRVPFAASRRIAVWKLHELMTAELARRKLTTWARMRQRAADLVDQDNSRLKYDAVFIDEAQDLHPNVIRMLVGMCISPDRLLLTADANQSIYGSGFNWNDIHEDLKFRGRTGLLRKNYRSTQQISDAAAMYLREAGLDPEKSIDAHVASGPEPAVRMVSRINEVPMITRFFQLATRDFRFGYSACAVLVPTEHTGKMVEEQLNAAGLDARFMASNALDLRSPSIKILTTRAAKGLEFPIVALAGLTELRREFAKDAEERLEYEHRERRALYVAMTRAMRGLLVLLPEDTASPLFTGFAEPYWNLESDAS